MKVVDKHAKKLFLGPKCQTKNLASAKKRK